MKYRVKKWAVVVRVGVITIPWALTIILEWLYDQSTKLLEWLDDVLPDARKHGED